MHYNSCQCLDSVYRYCHINSIVWVDVAYLMKVTDGIGGV